MAAFCCTFRGLCGFYFLGGIWWILAYCQPDIVRIWKEIVRKLSWSSCPGHQVVTLLFMLNQNSVLCFKLHIINCRVKIIKFVENIIYYPSAICLIFMAFLILYPSESVLFLHLRATLYCHNDYRLCATYLCIDSVNIVYTIE